MTIKTIPVRSLSLAAVAMASLLTGCASAPPAATAAGSEVDSLYVARVEKAARQMGTTVVWVNYPTRSGAPSASR